MTALTATTLADDPYAPEVLRDPYPFLTRLRAAGPAAWLTKYDVHAFGRDAEVREILSLIHI